MDASKINLFASWKPDNTDAEAEQKKLMNDPESLRQLGQKLDAVQRVWQSYIVERSRGEILPRVGDGVDRAQLPADCLAGLEKVRQQAGQWLQSPVSIGIGMSMQEADRALVISRFRGGDQITLWDEEAMTPELEEAHKSAAQEAAKSLNKAEGDAPGPKETPQNKGNAGGGFSGRHEPGAEEKPTPPRAEGSEHSQGEVAAAELENRPVVEGTHSGDLEEEFHDHAQAQEDQDQHEAEQRDRFQTVRAQVVQILQQVKQAAPQLEQLKQQAPGLYQVLMEMTKALVLTSKSLVDSEQKEAEEGAGVQKSERPLAKRWEDPDTELGTMVYRDAVEEGQGTNLGEQPIPMPPGRTPKTPVARPRSPREGSWKQVGSERVWDPTPVPRQGWELTQAASRRTLAAASANGGADSEPAFVDHNIHANGGQPIYDRDHEGGYTGGWKEERKYLQQQAGDADSRYWEGVHQQTQNKAFPIPTHTARHRNGTELPGHTHKYSWQFNGGRPPVTDENGEVLSERILPSWGITASAEAGARSPVGVPYDHQAGYFEVDPNTGLTGKYHAMGGYDEQNMRTHLDNFLRSLNGMHKKEIEASLAKGKLPLPENAPKHTKPNWPVGWNKDGKVKVAHPEEGKTSWVSVRAGQVLSNDGHPISSRNPEGR